MIEITTSEFRFDDDGFSAEDRNFQFTSVSQWDILVMSDSLIKNKRDTFELLSYTSTKKQGSDENRSNVRHPWQSQRA